jgi:hypothetical protein
MRITKKEVERKVARVVSALGKGGHVPAGREFFLSVMNCGDSINRYQLCWRPKGTAEENPVRYNYHVRGRQMYHFLEGLEEGLRLAGGEGAS